MGLGLELPRERLEALGSQALSDAELVALVLRTGTRDLDVLLLARRLLSRCGGLRGVARSGGGELRGSPGMGPAKTAGLLAALEIGRRLAIHRLEPGQRVRSAEDVHRHFYPRLRDTLHERFIALLLDGRHRFLGDLVISQGTLTASLVHPREVFRPAIREAAAAMVLVHNHPSGDPSPSREDAQVTRRLAHAGEILGVRVVDHVIVAEAGYYSFAEAGEMDERSRGDSKDGPPGEAKS
jgi:DNA repair protein RadC